MGFPSPPRLLPSGRPLQPEGGQPGRVRRGARGAPPNGLAKPINSLHLGAALNAKTLTSTVVGHSHLFSYSRATSADGRVIHGLSAGCCIGENDHHHYAGVSEQAWARGVCCLHGVEAGDYSLEWVALRRSWALYGASRRSVDWL